VSDVPGALVARGIDQQLRQQRPAERGRERVAAFVQRSGLEGRPEEEAKVSRASCTMAFFAPLRMALRWMPSRSLTDPRFPVQVTTSKPYVSRSQATATLVSRPPEYASTIVSPAVGPFTLISPPRIQRDAW
jgi:hypothetical protein